jgi:antitoxin component HigA of HigAB toxin-antitoxin module
MAIIDELMILGDEKMSRGQVDYLATLGRLVADYEREHVLAELGRAAPRDVLQHLMESRGMSAAELGRLLGSRSAATMILKGQRQMSKAHIRACAAHFQVSPAVFL